MRVIAGSARSLPLEVPPGKDIRPTIDRYKETVFNIVNQYVPGGTVLDIFSGSGAIGIEALSRGAKEAFFIENAGKAMACIENNLKFTKLFEKATLMKYDYNKALMMLHDRQMNFDMIYLDPPFDMNLEAEVIRLIVDYDLLSDDGIIICESSVKTDMSFIDQMDTLEIQKERAFNSCQFTFIKKID